MPKAKNKGTKPNKLTIHVCLDRSGSMECVRQSTIDSVNQYIADVAKANPDSTISITTFDDRDILTPVASEPISSAKLLKGDFEPRGMTPLYDAIGLVVGKLDDASAPDKVLVIVTDGHENASRKFDAKQIKQMLDDRQEQDNWLVLYLGANQNAIVEGAKLGISKNTSLTYALGKMSETMASASGSTARYNMAQTNKLGSATFTAEEREKSQ